MMARNEPILVSDLAVTAGNTGEILSFIPDNSAPLIAGGIIGTLAVIDSPCWAPGISAQAMCCISRTPR